MDLDDLVVLLLPAMSWRFVLPLLLGIIAFFTIGVVAGIVTAAALWLSFFILWVTRRRSADKDL